MTIVIINKSRRSVVSILLTQAMTHLPMLAMVLKTQLTVRMAQDDGLVGPEDAGVVIEDDGRFVTARVMWPVDK